MKVLFLTNLPSPYMVCFFRELGKLCDLTVIFERKESSERNGRWDHYTFENFKGIILKGIPMSPDSALSIGICRFLTKEYNYIIVANPMTPTGIVAIEYMRIRKIPYIIESEGSFPKDGKGIKEKLKKYIISNAMVYFSTTERADEYFLAYGADEKKIYHYPFTSLYKKDIIDSALGGNEKKRIRESKGFIGEKVAIAVGRLIPLKRYQDLILAWTSMPGSWSLYIVGEGEEKNALEKLCKEKHLNNVYFAGYKGKKELFELYKIADIFVHPTSTDVWGLVVNEAMACGLPVVTTNMCIAGDALVENGVNGYIISVGDVPELAEKIKKILESTNVCDAMSANSLKRISSYTFENMAQTHIQILKDIG